MLGVVGGGSGSRLHVLFTITNTDTVSGSFWGRFGPPSRSLAVTKEDVTGKSKPKKPSLVLRRRRRRRRQPKRRRQPPHVIHELRSTGPRGRPQFRMGPTVEALADCLKGSGDRCSVMLRERMGSPGSGRMELIERSLVTGKGRIVADLAQPPPAPVSGNDASARPPPPARTRGVDGGGWQRTSSCPNPLALVTSLPPLSDVGFRPGTCRRGGRTPHGRTGRRGAPPPCRGDTDSISGWVSEGFLFCRENHKPPTAGRQTGLLVFGLYT